MLGAGTMGGGIAMNFANVGIPVTIVERNQEALDKGLAVVRKNYERSASRGSIPAEAVEQRMALITGSTDKADFADCDIVIEAVFEDMELKQSIFTELDAICKPGALLASNTSALDVNKIAAVTSRPESVIGMHFFSPANVMKLLENVRGEKSSDTVVATTMAIGKRIGKIPVMVGVCPGFVGNRMLFSRGAEAERMILEGATPAQVDRVLFDFGFPMGPFAMSDLAGLDIGWKEEKSSSSTIREVLCENGRRGQKNGRGYYTYDPETRASTPDPEVEQLIKDFAVGKGIEQREITDQEVLERCLYPMVNEGAKILDEGIAIRGSDIDVVWVNGYGWPRLPGRPDVLGRLGRARRDRRQGRRSTASRSAAATGSCHRCCVASPTRAARCRRSPTDASGALGSGPSLISGPQGSLDLQREVVAQLETVPVGRLLQELGDRAVVGQDRVGLGVVPGLEHERALEGARVRQDEVLVVRAAVANDDHVDVEGARGVQGTPSPRSRPNASSMACARSSRRLAASVVSMSTTALRKFSDPGGQSTGSVS